MILFKPSSLNPKPYTPMYLNVNKRAFGIHDTLLQYLVVGIGKIDTRTGSLFA
jgi:hypothetical protein